MSLTQQKLHELALQLQEKDDHLSRQKTDWEEKLKHKEAQLSRERLELEQTRSECEKRLAAWEKSLKASAAGLGLL